jgi:hypothetical protein
MEILISIVILVLIVTMFYRTIFGLDTTQKGLYKHFQAFKNDEKLFYLLYKDLFLSQEFNKSSSYDKKYDIINIITSNSLHDIANPNVVYFVNKDEALIRLESAKPITLPVTQEYMFYIYADRLALNVDSFNILPTKESQTTNSVEQSISVDLPGAMPAQAENNQTKKGSANQTSEDTKATSGSFLVFLSKKSKKEKLLFEVSK